ncbi:MAG: hypothetical protein K2M12_03065, partial [Muribaculaceae bacterium]|nr:hypothetical protein [Muribaculaceae bacterium]
MKYSSGTGDALRRAVAELDDNGCFSLSLHTGTTVKCRCYIGDTEVFFYVVPGDTVSVTLDCEILDKHSLADAITFDGQLADFNHDLVYAREQGFDPESIYLKMEAQRNANKLAAELPAVSEDGYFQYLDSIYRNTNERIDADRVIGDAYREFAKAVNHYEYGFMISWCAQSIRLAGIDTDEAYAAYTDRQRQRVQQYMQDDPWRSPVLCYHMSGVPDLFIEKLVSRPVGLPDDFRQCNLATKYMRQIGQNSQLLSDAQLDSVRTFLPELGDDVLAYNDQLEQKLAVINKQGKSRICSLPDEKIASVDVLSAILEPYRGRPVLLDLWETTCVPCRLAFKDMHDKKLELADRVHFVNIASERSNLAAWERLVPSYVGDHYRLTEEQLQALHSQLPCDTDGVPVWVVINADGT